MIIQMFALLRVTKGPWGPPPNTHTHTHTTQRDPVIGDIDNTEMPGRSSNERDHATVEVYVLFHLEGQRKKVYRKGSNVNVGGGGAGT